MRKILVLSLAVALLSGCAATVDPTVDPPVSVSPTSTIGPTDSSENIVCIDWVTYATFDDAAATAQLIVVGTAEPSTTNVNLYGVDVPLHIVNIETVVAGDKGHQQIEVAAVPDACGASTPFATGDPLDTTGRIELFLVRTSGFWRLLNPWTGIEAVPDGGPLPWEPAPTP